MPIPELPDLKDRNPSTVESSTALGKAALILATSDLNEYATSTGAEPLSEMMDRNASIFSSWMGAHCG